jgi:hypothetical protein
MSNNNNLPPIFIPHPPTGVHVVDDPRYAPDDVETGRWVRFNHPDHGPATRWVWDEPGAVPSDMNPWLYDDSNNNNDVSIDYNITANTNNEFNPSHLLWQHQQPLPPPSYNNYNKTVRMPLRARAQSQTYNQNNIQNTPFYYQPYNSPPIFDPLPGRRHSIRRDFPPNYTNKSKRRNKRKNKSKRRNPSKRTIKKRKTKSRRRK